MTECIRYSVAPAPAMPRSRALRPDGRWRRILEALEAGPLSLGRIRAVTDPGRYTRRIEGIKIYHALRDMTAVGLVDHQRNQGWILTPHGAAALQHLRREEAGAARRQSPETDR